MSAKKADQNKPDLSLVPRAALDALAAGFEYGTKKYGRYNYYNGHRASQLVAAALRHITSWNEGEDLDAESGNSHLAHALCSLAMLVQQQKLGTLTDDRYSQQPDQLYTIPLFGKDVLMRVVSATDAPTTSDAVDGSAFSYHPPYCSCSYQIVGDGDPTRLPDLNCPNPHCQQRRGNV